MTKKSKKGFTIVELIIVIAVVAVLAAILIPTFIHLSQKAEKASDESLVTNLNKALAMREQEAGDTKNNIMHDAVLDLHEYGYELPQLLARSEEDLLWNSKTNRFVLSGDAVENDTTKFVDYWRIEEDIPTEQKYSIYAGHKWNAERKEVTGLTVGFDAGYHIDIASITYDRTSIENPEANKQTVGMRTNVGSLKINAPEDSVKHYGELETLTITAVKGASYHEHGKVRGKAIISSGHLEIEEGGEVPQVLVNNATGPVTVTANEPTIVIADSASESQTSVVANSTEVYVSGVSAGNVSGSESSSVVRAQDVTDNATLKAGLAAGGFYRIANTFEVSTAVDTPVGKTAVIDFNGKIITTGAWQWANNGTLTVTDSGENGGISCPKGCLDNYGTLTINGGLYTTTVIGSGANIWNNSEGTLIINDGKFEAARTAVINEGVAVLNGGKFNSTSTSANGSGNYAYCIISQNDMTINGGTVTGIHGAISFDNGKGIINNVNASTKEGDSKSYYALYVAGENGSVNVTVNGGTFVGGYRNAAHIGNKNKNGDGGIGAPASVTIHGGKFIAPTGTDALHVTFTEDGFGIGYAFIYGGTFSTKPADTYIGAGLSAVQNSDGTYTIK